jgi:hypothetical protein
MAVTEAGAAPGATVATGGTAEMAATGELEDWVVREGKGAPRGWAEFRGSLASQVSLEARDAAGSSGKA